MPGLLYGFSSGALLVVSIQEPNLNFNAAIGYGALPPNNALHQTAFDEQGRDMVSRFLLASLSCTFGALVASNAVPQGQPLPPDHRQMMATHLARCSGIEREMSESFREGGVLSALFPRMTNSEAPVRGLRGRSEERIEAAGRYLRSWLVATEAEPMDEALEAKWIEEIAASAAIEMRKALESRDERRVAELAGLCSRL